MDPLRALFYWTIKTIAWPVTRLYVRLRVVGADRVPRRGACLVVANHTSYLDAIVLGSAFPRRVRFLITRPIYAMWRLRWFYYMMGSIALAPDVPDRRALKEALGALRRGGVVGIFPEGQRMIDGNLGSAKAGAAMIAARSGAPVVPAAIIGAWEAMPVGALFPSPRPIRVVFGEPLTFPPAEGRRPTREQLDAFAERIMRAIAELMAGNGSPEGARGRSLQSTSS